MGSMVMTETRPPEAQGPEVGLEAGEFRARCAELEARLGRSGRGGLKVVLRAHDLKLHDQPIRACQGRAVEGLSA